MVPTGTMSMHTSDSGNAAREAHGRASLASTFGRHTFNLDTMRKRLPRPVFEAIQATCGGASRSTRAWPTWSPAR